MKVRFHIPVKLFGHSENNYYVITSEILVIETTCSMPALPRNGDKVSFGGTGDLGIGQLQDLFVQNVLWHTQIQPSGPLKRDVLVPLVTLKQTEPAGWQQEFCECERSLKQELEEFKKEVRRSENAEGHTFRIAY
jgi:hypothetical protein